MTNAPVLTGDSGNLIVELLIIIPPVLGLLYCVYAWWRVSKVEINGHPDKLRIHEQSGKGGLTPQEIVDRLKRISKIIENGAMTFLFREYKYMAGYIVLFSFVLLGALGWAKCHSATEVNTMNLLGGIPATIAFVVGAITSILAGYVGMRIATFSNVRVTHECWIGLGQGFDVALQGGSVMGISLVCMGIIALYFIIKVFTAAFLDPFFAGNENLMYEAIAGYGLGGSSIALFGRVGGGIYTKAADVGADLSGKNNYGLEEDDYRNPGCIADNVGDNVGDIAGMGADLFGSFAESTCAALVLVTNCEALKDNASVMYPVMITSTGIIVGILTLLITPFLYPVKEPPSVEKACKGVLIISTVLMTPVVCALSYTSLPAEFVFDKDYPHVHWYDCAISVCLGLWSGLIIGFVTEYYTSHSYNPVREISVTQKQSAATGIIYGLALGYLSCIIPVFCLGATILIGHQLCGMFGVALGALGMLGTMTMGLTIDAYGPISDNAGGLAEMAEMDPSVRAFTDCLDAAGNTTAAIGKGFAIGSAALVSLALFGAFTTRANVTSVDILDPFVFTGLLLGAMMPYAFAAWTMKSVGMAANDLLMECLRQFPEIMENGKEPDYTACISISTDASLREMLAPGALVILSPLIAGFGFGANTCAGLLSGALVSSVQLAISMSNSGGAWDNSKKYISAGGLGKEYVKGSEAHKNSVTGDTVGDPLKDTSGPALNIVMKLTAIISLVFSSAIAAASNCKNGPIWLTVACPTQ